MGMYTEIYVRARLIADAPPAVIKLLQYMTGESDAGPSKPEHALFATPGWDIMLRCSSYYHVPKSITRLWYDDISRSWYLCGRADLKNYDNEIGLFFDWVAKFCDDGYLGHSLYEEFDAPILYRVSGRRLEVMRTKEGDWEVCDGMGERTAAED